MTPEEKRSDVNVNEQLEKEVFKKGDRVRMTEYGVQQFPGRKRKGIVANNPRTNYRVAVLEDGNKIAYHFNVDFWEHDQ